MSIFAFYVLQLSCNYPRLNLMNGCSKRDRKSYIEFSSELSFGGAVLAYSIWGLPRSPLAVSPAFSPGCFRVPEGESVSCSLMDPLVRERLFLSQINLLEISPSLSFSTYHIAVDAWLLGSIHLRPNDHAAFLFNCVNIL